MELQRKQREEFKMAKFLAGLRPKYENISSPILTNNEVPCLYEEYSQVRCICVSPNNITIGDKSSFVSSSDGCGCFMRT